MDIKAKTHGDRVIIEAWAHSPADRGFSSLSVWMEPTDAIRLAHEIIEAANSMPLPMSAADLGIAA